MRQAWQSGARRGAESVRSDAEDRAGSRRGGGLRSLALATFAAALTASSTAFAEPITATAFDSYGSQIVASGSPVDGKLDVNAWLAPGTEYVITEASILFFFEDDREFQLIEDSLGEYIYEAQWGRYKRFRTVEYYDEPERADVRIGNEIWSGSSRYDVDGGGGLLFDGVVSGYAHYTQILGRTTGYWGRFNVQGELSAPGLADLADDGILDFTVSAHSDFKFIAAQLTFTAQEAQVPEPGALGLLGVALAGLGLVRWRP